MEKRAGSVVGGAPRKKECEKSVDALPRFFHRKNKTKTKGVSGIGLLK